MGTPRHLVVSAEEPTAAQTTARDVHYPALPHPSPFIVRSKFSKQKHEQTDQNEGDRNHERD